MIVDVELIAELMNSSRSPESGRSRDVDEHPLETSVPGVRGGVAARHLADLHFAARSRSAVHSADQAQPRRRRASAKQRGSMRFKQCDAVAASETDELALHSADRVPISGDEQQHCELRPEGGHRLSLILPPQSMILRSIPATAVDAADGEMTGRSIAGNPLSQSGSVPEPLTATPRLRRR
jgi:hypothetical protein